MAKITKTISVVTRTQDNGDGGYTTYAYNNENELINEHPKSNQFKQVNGKYQYVKVELSQKERDEIINEYDPYENGYIGTSTIEIEFDDETGEMKLLKPLRFHAGQ